MTVKVAQYEILIEIDLPSGTVYYSRDGGIVFDGHTYVPRIEQIGELAAAIIERTENELPKASFTLDNIADMWTGPGPLTQATAVAILEDRPVRIRVLDVGAGVATLEASGLLSRPDFDPNSRSCSFEVRHPLDAQKIEIPRHKLGKLCPYRFNGSPEETANGSIPSLPCGWTMGVEGLNPEYPEASATSCDKTLDGPNGCWAHNNAGRFGGLTHIAGSFRGVENNRIEKEEIREAVAPIIIGATPLKTKPLIYRARLVDSRLIVNGIVSTCQPGKPFDSDALPADRVKLWNEVRASRVEVYPGASPQPIPADKTLFPEDAGHGGWFYFAAEFRLTPEQVDRAADIDTRGDITVRLEGGRDTARAGQTENPVYALEDALRDPLNGLAVPTSMLDSSAITAAASYVGGRFRGVYRWQKARPVLDFIRANVGTFHGYLRFEDGLLGIHAKRHDESPVATFGTGGIPLAGEPKWTEKDFEDLVNEVTFKHRTAFNQPDRFTWYDKGAQIRAGNGLERPVTADWFLEGLYDTQEAKISAAIWFREEQSANGFLSVPVHFIDWLESGVKTGQVIRVNSADHIPGQPGDNYLFRVQRRKLNPDTYVVTLDCQVYDGAVYGYNADELGDVIRDGEQPSTGGRPPDVENVSATIVDFYTDEGDPANDDDDQRMDRVLCEWTYPDLSAQMAEDVAEGLNPEYPIAAVRLLWQYDDDSSLHFEQGPRIEYPVTSGHVIVPHHKKRMVRVWFVPIGRNNGQGALGYVLDPARITYLDENVNDTEPAIDVGDGAIFAPGDYARSEGEIMRVASVATNTVTMEDTAGVRDQFFNTDALEHSEGTEIGVAVRSHPTALVDMSTARHTLGIVQNVTMKRRPKGIKVEYDDLTTDNEAYFIAWALDEALLKPAAGEGSAGEAYAPAWYLDDPDAPPAGVFLIKNRDLDRHIHYEDIDAAYGGDATGVPVYVRVFARIKKNHSSKLSALATEKHGNGPVGPPSTPFGADGLRTSDLEFEVIPGSDRVRCIFTIGAKEESPFATTFEAQDITTITPVLQKWVKGSPGSWQTKKKRAWEEVEDPSTASQQVETTLHRGSKWRWAFNAAKNRGSKSAKSPVVNYEFRVGQTTDDIAGIPDLTIQPFGSNEDTHSVEINSRNSTLLITLTQPVEPVALSHYKVQKKKSSATRWKNVAKESLTDDSEDVDIQTAGAKKIRQDVTHGENASMDYRVRLVAADGSKSAWATLTSSSGAGGDPSIIPPPVENVTVVLGDVFTDDDGREIHLVADWDYADVGPLIADGTYAANPYRAVKLYWRYDDEGANDWKEGTRVKHPDTTGQFSIPFHRSRSAEVAFVAIGPGGGRLEDIGAAPSYTIPLGTNRFTYPVVTGVEALTRRDGIRLEWDDPDREAIEKFLVYYSTDPAALADDAPDWYLTEPTEPGVTPPEPEVYFSDDLDRADGPLGSPWVDGASAFSISGNAAVSPSTGGTAGVTAMVNTGHTAKAIKFIVGSLAGSFGAICRYNDANNFLWVNITIAGAVQVFYRQAGTNVSSTVLPSTSALVVGDELEVWDDGATIMVFKNGTFIGATTDTRYNTSTTQGIRAGTSSPGVSFLSVEITAIQTGTRPTIFSDDFNRPDGALGGSLTVVCGAYTIQANQARSGTGASGAGSAAIINTGQTNVWCEVVMGSNAVGIVLRYISPTEFIWAEFNGATGVCRVVEVNGTATNPFLTDNGATWTPIGSTVAALASGNTIALYVNGVYRASWVGSQKIAGAGIQGLRHSATAGQLADSFAVYEIVPEPEAVGSIEYLTTKDPAKLVRWETLGAEGVEVYFRVAAVVKHNYSSALSARVSNHHTNKPIYTPSTPTTGDLSNALDGDVAGRRTVVKCTVRPKEGSTTTTWAEAAAKRIIPRFALQSAPTAIIHAKPFNVTDQAATSFVCDLDFRTGKELVWVDTVVENDSGEKTSAQGNISFTAGQVNSAISSISGLAVSALAWLTNRKGSLTIGFTNAASPAHVTKLTIEEKRTADSDTTYTQVKKVDLSNDASLSTAGAKTVGPINFPHTYSKANTTLRITLFVDGGGSVSITTSSTTPGDTPTSPVLKHAKVGKYGLTVNYKKPSGNFSGHNFELEFSADSGGVTIFDPVTGAVTPGHTVFSDHTYHTDITKRELRAAGITAAWVRARYIAKNPDDNSNIVGAYSAFEPITFGRLQLEDDTQVPPQVGPNHGKNLLRGAKMLHGANDYKDSAGNPIGLGSELGKHWFLTPSTSGTRINDSPLSGALGIRWNKTYGWIEFSTDAAVNGQSINAKISKSRLRNEKLTLALPLMGSTGFSPGTFTFGLWDDAAADWIVSTTRSFALTTAVQVLKDQFTIPSGYTMNGAILFRIVPPNWGTAALIYTTKIMLVNGNREALFSEAEEDESADSALTLAVDNGFGAIGMTGGDSGVAAGSWIDFG